MSAPAQRRYRTVLYWRPLVPGLNDTDEHLDQACALSQHADATVFTGLFYRDQIAEYYRANGLTAFSDSDSLFRKTSCAVSYAHGVPDYNGHYGIRELCDICPLSQLDLCRDGHHVPTAERLREVAGALPTASGLVVVDITDRAAVVSGLSEEQPRYYLQHALGFQVHDVRHPHHEHRHGRADIGWKDAPTDE